jgi:hypothetical protein
MCKANDLRMAVLPAALANCATQANSKISGMQVIALHTAQAAAAGTAVPRKLLKKLGIRSINELMFLAEHLHNSSTAKDVL